jgi:hypothetical protein
MSTPASRIISPQEAMNPASGHERRIYQLEQGIKRLEGAMAGLINQTAQQYAQIAHQFNSLAMLCDILAKLAGPEKVQEEAERRSQEMVAQQAEAAPGTKVAAP